MIRKLTAIFVVLGVCALRTLAEPGTMGYTDTNTGITVLSTRMDLPFPGVWFVDEQPAEGLTDIFCNPDEEAVALLFGRRQSAAREQREIQLGARVFRQLFRRVREYAKQHEGMSPSKVEDLVPLGFNPEKLNWAGHGYYVGSRQIVDRSNAEQFGAEPEILAFELTPLVDDGKHWRILTDGVTKREFIDPSLAELYDVAIVPGRPPIDVRMATPNSTVKYTFLARHKNQRPDRAVIRLRNGKTGKVLEQAWELAPVQEGDRKLISEWATMRFASLPLSGLETEGGPIMHWLARAGDLYGTENIGLLVPGRRERGGRRVRWSSMLSVMGGRAAIRETLQMQGLASAGGTDDLHVPEIDLNSIEGVTVKSHPFEVMLGGAPGGSLSLADVIPLDRFFVYFAKPDALLKFLDGGSAFLFRTGASSTGHSLEYNLKQRYLANMGLSEKWMRALLTGGAVRELAVMLPDLFLIDGTEITVVARLKNPVLATAALRIIGIQNLDDRAVVTTSDESEVFWARRGDLLLVSTHEGELDRVLALRDAEGKGSLGKSAEFRYMLTQLPIGKDTAMWSYFSDPFIRRMVSPAIKIGQLRRLSARTELESLNAGMLLYKLDGHTSTPSLDELASRRYAMLPRHVQDAEWNESQGATSVTYGRPGNMFSLMDRPIHKVTKSERDAYQQYLTNYNRFWRRFFDPIAIRVDNRPDGAYEVGVFILPLLDNSIYNGLRRAIQADFTPEAILTPVIEPLPVAELSFNLDEEAWLKLAGELGDEFAGMAGIPGALLDYLGPDIHISLADANPILGMGSGELSHLMGVFGGGMDDEMFILPAIVSMLTRPAALLVGLTDPHAVRNLLRNIEGRNIGHLIEDEVRISLYRVAGRDAWIYSIDIAGLMSVRLGVEVQDRFLVIKNLPMTQRLQVTGTNRSNLSGAQLALHPEACREQLAPLFASASEKERQAALAGSTYLYPFMANGAETVALAAKQHAAWFGFKPVHPPPGHWNWEQDRLTSSMYGDERNPLQPPFKPEHRTFGILQGMTDLKVSMQFEHEGLRTSASWKTSGANHP